MIRSMANVPIASWQVVRTYPSLERFVKYTTIIGIDN